MNAPDSVVLLDTVVERFFAGPGAAWAGAPGVVALSGGADSTALAAVLARRARERGLPLVAAHLDHGLDAESSTRATAAAATARRLGLPCVQSRRPPLPGSRPPAGREAAARQRRYPFLAEVAARHRAAWVATAHHRDDQAETVLLRLLFGSGVAGLAGIRAVAELAPGVALLRPLLGVDRAEIVAMLEAAGIGWTEDPTNRDPTVARNRVRHLLLPRLAADEGVDPATLSAALARLATVAGRAEGSLARDLARRLDLRPAAPATPPSLDAAALAALPEELLAPALALLHRVSGEPYPPPAAAARELARQLRERQVPGNPVSGARAPLACDAGGGRSWRDAEGRLELVRTLAATGAEAAPFSYTLTVPGELEVAELGLRFRLVQRPPAGWMFEGRLARAGLSLPLAPGDRVVIRNRRSGDRLRPFGAAGSRRLKELLIDHRVPRRQRDRIALLCLGPDGGEIAWVPGVTIEHRYRLERDAGAAPVWVAEILPSMSDPVPPEPPPEGNRWLGATVGRSEVTNP